MHKQALIAALGLLLGCPADGEPDDDATADDDDSDDDDSDDDDDSFHDDDDQTGPPDDDDTGPPDDDDATQPEDGTWFENWTFFSGVGATEPQGCSVSIGDLDGDGWPDFYASAFGPDQLLYRNNGDGTFTDVLDDWGPLWNGQATFGSTFTDYDNDGDPDLFVLNGGANLMLRNDGDHFTDVTAGSGLAGDEEDYGNSMAFADFDGDGDLDAYLANGEENWDPKTQLADAPDRLFRQDAPGVFTDLSHLIPEDNRRGAGFVAGWSDYDHDGDPDLYVVNDFGNVVSNQMFRNDGPSATQEWAFTVVTETCGCNLADAGMGLGIGDYDRDGWQDIYTSNGAIDVMGDLNAEKLLRNFGDGTFVDVTVAAGAQAADLPERESSWGVTFFDLDNDGWLDIYAPFGLGDRSEPDRIVKNTEGHFEAIDGTGIETPNWTNGVGIVDFDLDGCLDVITSSRRNEGLQVFHNKCETGNHYLQLKLVGTTSNRDAVGAVAIASVNGLELREEVVSGSTSAHSSRWKVLHFGLAGATVVPSIEITWPSGAVQTLTDVAADQLLTVVEGE